MNAQFDENEDENEYIDIWTIPLDAVGQGEVVLHHPSFSGDTAEDSTIFQLPDEPYEGFHPRLRRYDDAA